MIKFSNGYQLTFACASGALAFNGDGWPWEQPFRWLGLLRPKEFTIVAKTTTIFPIKGNLNLRRPWRAVRLVRPKSAVNAVGLTNPGVKHWLENDLPKAQAKGYRICPSFKIDTIPEANLLVHLINYGFPGFRDFPYIEVNVSCPNTTYIQPHQLDILQILRSLNAPKVLKLSERQINEEFINATEEYVEAYHAINTIPWSDLFDERSPLAKYNYGGYGGVSGRLIKIRARKAVAKLRNLTDCPIIGGGGIETLEDVEAMVDFGAEAISIGTLFLYKPWKPNQIVNEWRKKYAN